MDTVKESNQPLVLAFQHLYCCLLFHACVCVFISNKKLQFSWFSSAPCASLALLVQSARANSFKQTSQTNSISILLYPSAPSPSCWPIFLQTPSLSLSLFANFGAYLHSSVSYTPSHPVSSFLLCVCLWLAHCRFFHLCTCLSSPLPLSPVPLMCCWEGCRSVWW